MKIKFCGITNLEDIQHAEAAGADFLGFILVDSSPRRVTLSQAAQLISKVKKAKAVLVCDLDSASEIREIYSATKPAYMQLHNQGGPISGIEDIPTIQAFRGVQSIEVLQDALERNEYVLIDKGPEQDVADFNSTLRLPSNLLQKLFIAGGINKDNIDLFIDYPDIFALDLARGSEISPGKKDPELMLYLSNKIKS